MKLTERHFGEKIITQNLLIFYFVGLILYFVPFTHEIFFWVLPFQLLFVNIILFYHHKDFNMKVILIFSFIFLSSWFVEYLGITYGSIFGEYVYLDSLGIKIFNVPLLIGLNWVMLVYSSNALAGKITKNRFVKVISAASFMVMYDIVIEFIAADLNMWQFTQEYPPLRNFISWFLLAVIYNFLIELFQVKTNNKAARVLILIQTGFFLIIFTASLF